MPSVRPSEEFIFAHQSFPSDWVWGYPLLRTCYTPESDQQWDAVIAKIQAYLHREVDGEHVGSSVLQYLPGEVMESFLAIARSGGQLPPYPELDRGPTEEVKRRLRIQVFEDKEALENASVEKARDYYNRLREEGRIQAGLMKIGFLLLDQESIQSVFNSVEPSEAEYGKEYPFGYVKFVEGTPKQMKEGKYQGWLKVQLTTLWYFMNDASIWEEGLHMICPRIHPDGTMDVYDGGHDDEGWDSE